MRLSLALWGALVLCAAGSPAATFAAAPVPYLPVPRGAAVILNTGSTNAPGYRVVVRRSGEAEYVRGDRRSTGGVSPALADRFFTDLAASMPLSKLPGQLCAKSASFGTSLFVWWRGQRSPDLSCPGDDRGRAVAADADEIANALNLSAGQPVMRPLPPNEPRKILSPEPAPSASS